MSHLLELRNRLIYAFGTIGALFLMLVWFRNDIFEFVAQPLNDVLNEALSQGGGLPREESMQAIGMGSPFLTPVRLTLMVSIIAAIPMVLYQIWAFVAPGLYRHERRLVLPLLISSVTLFYAGMAFAYFLVFPVTFEFLMQSGPDGVRNSPDIQTYIDFVFSMFFGFGVAFEVPVAVVILCYLGIVNPDTLAQKRSYIVIGAFVIAAVLTPPDIFSQFLLAVPMLLLFELGLFIARRMTPRRATEDVASNESVDP